MSAARITPSAVRAWPLWAEMDADGRKAAITALVGEGCTASGVAAKLSTTRNAVLGFCHRNGLPFGAAPATDAYGRMRPKNERSAAGGYATRKKAGVTLAGPAVGRPAVGSRQSTVGGEADEADVEVEPLASMGGCALADEGMPAPLPTADCRLPTSGPIGFMSLTDQRCKRPLWPDGPVPRMDGQLFCGAPSVAGSSWCPACAGRLLAGAPQPQRRAWRGG